MIKIIKKEKHEILGLKSPITEMKNLPDRLKSRKQIWPSRRKNNKHRSIGNIQSEEQKVKEWRKMDRASEICGDEIKHIKITHNESTA